MARVDRDRRARPEYCTICKCPITRDDDIQEDTLTWGWVHSDCVEDGAEAGWPDADVFDERGRRVGG